jgi:hypothetical protein
MHATVAIIRRINNPLRIGKMKMHHHKSWALALALIPAVALGFNVRADSVTATVNSPEVAVGQSAQLTVTLTGSQTQPSIPSVDGLEITPNGQSTQVEIINGSMTASASDTYEITPQREGTFVIPGIRAGNATSQPITLHAVKGSGMATTSSPSTVPGPSPALPPPSVGSGADDASTQPEGGFGSIQVIIPKRAFYVGEFVPVEIKAFIPEGLTATVTDLPQFTSDGLTLNSLSAKPDQNSKVINGQPFTVLTWHSALTAVKSGDYSIDLKMPESVVVPQASPQMNADDGTNFDNFFKNAFASMGTLGTKKEVTLESSAKAVKVLPLPQTNRPADFNGAVGQFEIEASATPTQVNAGDPITLRLKVTGAGNFDRVSPTLLTGDSRWKTYSAKSHFDPADSVGYQGVKTFEQPIIPNNSSVSAVPALSFSFFNPETRQYVSRTTTPVAVAVSGSPANSTPAAPQVAAAPPPTSPPAPTSGLRSNQIDSGSFVSTLCPIYLNPWFIAGQGVPILALIGGLAFLRRQKMVSDSKRVRAAAIQQAIRQQIIAMDMAMKNHETDAFFIHARTALQQRFGQQWDLRPETITLADIEGRLGNESRMVRPLFEMADQASYSDLHFEDADLREWRQIVLNELQPAEKN